MQRPESVWRSGRCVENRPQITNFMNYYLFYKSQSKTVACSVVFESGTEKAPECIQASPSDRNRCVFLFFLYFYCRWKVERQKTLDYLSSFILTTPTHAHAFCLLVCRILNAQHGDNNVDDKKEQKINWWRWSHRTQHSHLLEHTASTISNMQRKHRRHTFAHFYLHNFFHRRGQKHDGTNRRVNLLFFGLRASLTTMADDGSAVQRVVRICFYSIFRCI